MFIVRVQFIENNSGGDFIFLEDSIIFISWPLCDIITSVPEEKMS